MEKGKISAIVPVYNGAQWIGACLESLLAQTYQNFEALILDDHSADGTVDIVRAFQRKDPRIRLIQRDQRGVSSARNEGMREADGEFFTFVDADDKLDSRIFEMWAAVLDGGESDLALCGYRTWDGAEDRPLEKKSVNSEYSVNKIEYRNNSDNNIKNIEAERFLSDYILRGNSHCWGILYRRSAIGNVSFREDLTIGEDMMFLMDLLPNLTQISILDYEGYYYRINRKGVMLRPFLPSYMDEIKSWRMAAEMIERDFPAQRSRANGILAVSAILVAGKLAVLSAEERKKYQDCIEVCRETVRQALKTAGAKRELPDGYGIKAALFLTWPALYLNLYHGWKRKEV